MIDYEVLRFIWWLLIGILLIGFAVADGFDMGVGMLTRFLGLNDTERRIMINAIAPHWDGNPGWLITAGGALFAARRWSRRRVRPALCGNDSAAGLAVLPSGRF